MNNVKHVIENWSFGANPKSPYDPPELWQYVLQGEVMVNGKWTNIQTTTPSYRDGEIIITRSGSRYALGEVDPEYEKLYPDARNRLMAMIPNKPNGAERCQNESQ